MFQLLVALMSIGLVLSLAVASIYHGGKAFDQSRAVASARPAIVQPARVTPPGHPSAMTPLERAAAARASAPGEFVTVDGR